MATRTQTYDVDIADMEFLRHGDAPLLARLFKPRGSGLELAECRFLSMWHSPEGSGTSAQAHLDDNEVGCQ